MTTTSEIIIIHVAFQIACFKNVLDLIRIFLKLNSVVEATTITAMKPKTLNLDYCFETPFEINVFVHFEADRNVFQCNYDHDTCPTTFSKEKGHMPKASS